MLGKTEVKAGRPRGDGRHCDLCGCSFPAVRCDKCGSQIFCLSCDDMYHRHPKRRYHLRKAVDPTPTPQARPVLPMKVSQLASTPGDPSKMPLPPPRKKKPGKSFFDSFRRGSPSSDNSPPLPKKEYSWTDRLGSIKKFMSNRPLPPLPKDEDKQEQRSSPPVPRKNDLSFIHKRVDEKPPQLPHRTQAKSPSRKLSEGDLVPMNQDSHMTDKQAEWASSFGTPINNFRQTPTAPPPTQHLNGQANRDSAERELSSGRYRSRSLQEDRSPTGIPNFPEPPNLSPTMPPDVRGYSTLKRPSPHGQDIHNQSFMSMPGDHFPGMHTSSSVTDLHTFESPNARGPQQFPNFPMPPHYPHPYPIYPHYPNYPQYFGTSFANLSTALPTTDGDFSDHSDASGFSGKKHHKHSAFGIKAKRSQSVMYDRMSAYPPQYYPFGGFPPHPPLPGYGAAPWGPSDLPVETPPSPATSVRSFGRSHRSRHRKKKMVASDNEDEDERLSVLSSPRSRTTSSSDRLRKRKTPKKFERSVSPSSLTSSEEEEKNQGMEDRLSPEVHAEYSQGDGFQTKQDKKKGHKQVKDSTKSDHKTKHHGSKTRSASHQKLKTDDKNFSPKFKKKEKAPLSSSESMDVNEEQVEPLRKTEEDVQGQKDAEMEEESDYHSEEDIEKGDQLDEPKIESALSEGQWQCEHCTFINNGEHRICQVCYKTKPGSVPLSDSTSLLVPEMQASSSAAASPDIPALNTTSESLTSDTAKEFMTPPAVADDESHSAHSENEGQNFAKLNSDLEQAEKELSRGLMELMKLKEESTIASAQATNRRLSDDTPENREALTPPNTQAEQKPVVPKMEAALPQLSDKLETSGEQMNHYPNIQKPENVSSKSIGTDSMDFDFSTHQARAAENLTVPTAKVANFDSYTQDQVSPSNSFSEIASSSPSNQKDTAGKPALRRDSSCQTYQEGNVPQIENEIPPLSRGDNFDFQYPYNRADAMKSPQLPPIAPAGYRGFSGRNQGLMHRSHSRSSLFGDRYGDARAVPPEFDNLGFGFGPSPMYRSLSRSSLTGDYSDPWMSDARSLRRPDFYLSMEELVERRRLETKRAQGLELVRMIREAEQQGFTADDIHVALNNCGKQNPVDWLQTNWRGMVDTVVTLATNYGKDKHENDIGVLSENEARDSLRMHKGNIWAAVTECVEGRQRKFLELKARGNFSTKEIVDALTHSEGNVELAYTRLSATTLKPFLMRIWGAGEGVENQDGAVCDPTEFLDPRSSGWPKSSTLRAGNVRYGDTERCSDQEDWDDDDEVEDEVSWNEDEEDEMENPENFDIEPQIINQKKRGFVSNHITTPESDSEYCDAFDPVGEARSATSSSPVDEIFFVSPDDPVMELKKDKKKGTSFLSRLAALRKNKKPEMEDAAEKDDDIKQSMKHETPASDSRNITVENDQGETKILPKDSNTSNGETNKIYSPLNILKQTFSAIKDSVIGSNNKNETKHPRSIAEARTIIVHDRAGQESLLSEETEDKENDKNLNRGSPRAHKDDGIRKITAVSEYDERQTVRPPSSENLKDNSVNKVLPSTSAVISDVRKSNSSTSLVKIPAKQQRSENSEPEDKNVTDTTNILNNEQKNMESTSGNKLERGKSQVLTKTLPLRSMEDGSMSVTKSTTPEMPKQQLQDNDDGSVDLKAVVKNNLPITKQSPPEKSEENRLLTQQKCAVMPDKMLNDSNSTTVDLPQDSFGKSTNTTSSNEVTAEAREKNDSEGGDSLQKATSDAVIVEAREKNYSEGDDLLQKVTSGVVDDNDAHVASGVKKPEMTPDDAALTKHKDAKPKTKKQREGLRLKLPGLEKTTNSEAPKDQTIPDGQEGEFSAEANTTPKVDIHLDEKQKVLKKESVKVATDTAKTNTSPKVHIHLDEKQKALKQESEKVVTDTAKTNASPIVDIHLDVKQTTLRKESGKVVETATESHSLENIMFQKSKRDQNSHDDEMLPVKPADDNSSSIDMGEKNEENIVIGEKLKVNISENEFHDMASKITEKMENCLEVLKSSEAAFTGGEQNVPSSSGKEQDASAPNETTHSKSNSFDQNSETIKDKVDKIATDVPKVSTDHETKKKHDGAETLLSNRNDKRHADDENRITDAVKETSVSPEQRSSSGVVEKLTIREDKTLEQPSTITSVSDGNTDDKFVTDSTFGNDPVRDNDEVSVTKPESSMSQMPSSSSPTIYADNSMEDAVIFAGVKAKTFTGVVNKKAKGQLLGSDKKQKEISISITIPKTTHSITQNDKASADKKDALEEKQKSTNSTGAYGDEHVTQPHQSETDIHVQSSNISNEGQVSPISNDQTSQGMSDGSKSETSFSAQTEHKRIGSGDPASSETHQSSKQQEEEKAPPSEIATDSTATEESSESKSESTKSKEQDKNISAATNSEASVSTVLDSQAKEQEAKISSASSNSEVIVSASANSETAVSASAKSEASVPASANSEASVSGSESQAKKPDANAASALAKTEASVSTTSKVLDHQATEQDTKAPSALAETVASVSTTSKVLDYQAKVQDTKNSTEATNSEVSVPSSSKSDKPSAETKEIAETTSGEGDNVPLFSNASGDKRPTSRVETLRHSFRDEREGSQGRSQSPLRPQSPFGRMTSLSARREAIAQERNKETRNTPTVEKKPWFIEKVQPPKPSFPKRSIKQQLEFERKIRKLVSERKCRTCRKAEIVVQLLELNFAEGEALQAAHECSTLEQAISYLQQECLLCTGMYPVGQGSSVRGVNVLRRQYPKNGTVLGTCFHSVPEVISNSSPTNQIVSMIHCPHKACRECIKAYFTIQIRDRTIMELLCPFCNEPDLSDEDVAQDYFNHLDILLKKLVEPDIHELFQRKLRDRVLMKDPNFRWCSQCSSGFIAMPNLKRLICPDCNAITCASCRRPWEREHEGVSCEAFAAWKDANDPEAHAAGLAKLLQEDGIDCPNCHFRYTLAKGGCMHFRCIQCQHDFCSGCSKPFKMGQKCGVSEFCGKLGLHAHHPRNCLFYLRDKDPEDLQRLLELNDVDYNKDPPEGMELKSVCQVMEQKETSDGLVDDICGKEVLESQAGLCRVHYVEYLGQMVNKHKIDPIQIFCNDDLELVLKRASKRLPPKGYRDSEVKYREKLLQLIQEELPLEQTEAS